MAPSGWFCHLPSAAQRKVAPGSGKSLAASRIAGQKGGNNWPQRRQELCPWFLIAISVICEIITFGISPGLKKATINNYRCWCLQNWQRGPITICVTDPMSCLRFSTGGLKKFSCRGWKRPRKLTSMATRTSTMVSHLIFIIVTLFTVTNVINIRIKINIILSKYEDRSKLELEFCGLPFKSFIIIFSPREKWYIYQEVRAGATSLLFVRSRQASQTESWHTSSCHHPSHNGVISSSYHHQLLHHTVITFNIHAMPYHDITHTVIISSGQGNRQ